MKKFCSNLAIYLSILLTVLSSSCNLKKKDENPSNYAIIPPLKGVKVKPEVKTIDPAQAQIVKSTNDTYLGGTANAFIDEAGQLIKTPPSSCNLKKKDENPSNYAIIPPLKEVKVKPEVKTIDPAQAQIVKFANGTYLEVPANAFIDEAGQLVKTPVNLALEVYDDKAKVLASGIPMTYQKDGKEQYFESAGMFQLTGKSADKEVNIATDKQLIVNFASKVSGNDFDFFYFEEKPIQPVFKQAQIGRTILPLPTRKGRWKKLTNRVKDNSLKAFEEINRFRLKFEKDNFPELAGLETIHWKLATPYKNPKDSLYNWVLKEKWMALELSQPQYITGNPYRTIPNDKSTGQIYRQYGISQSTNRFVLNQGNQLLILDAQGKLIQTITGLIDEPGNFQICEDKYLLVSKHGGAYLYDLNGKKIGFYGELSWGNVELSLKNNRAVFQGKNTHMLKDHIAVKLADLSGKVLKTLALPEEKRTVNIYNMWDARVLPSFRFCDDKYLITSGLNGIKVYDLNGKLLKQKPGKFQHFYHFEGDKIFIKEFSGRLRLWNFSTGRELLSPPGAFDLNNKKVGLSMPPQKIPKNPVLLIYEPGKYDTGKLWNYKTNQVTPLGFSTIGSQESMRQDTIAPEIMAGYDRHKGFYLYNLHQNKILTNIPNYRLAYFTEATYVKPPKNKKLRRILINSDQVVQMLNFEGQVVKDFKKYDSTIFCVGFTLNDKIYSLSKTGTYRQWNDQGQLLLTKTWKNGAFDATWLQGKEIWTFRQLFKSYKAYDLQGNLLKSLGKEHQLTSFADTLLIQRNNSQGYKFRVLPQFKRPTQVYQLNLHTSKKEFITYVYLDDPQQQRMIAKYKSFSTQKMVEEARRKQQEMALVRSFPINKLGLYNWDRLQKEKNRIRFVADFDFQQATDYNDVVVFLITDLQGISVIPFYQKVWNRFSIDPTVNNRLVAVLPKNKIAIVSQEQMAKIDWQKVKKEKKYKFTMKLVEHSVENLEMLTKVLQ